MILLVAFLLFGASQGKIYDRCELARELKFVHNAADHQLATWVCIAEHESQYNTSIVGHQNGDGSGDHGIFQISDKFWCSPPGKGFACGVTCNELEDDNISDDFECAQRIYREHKQLSGDGFNAWAVYKPHCKGPKADRYIKDCFNDSESPKTITTPPSVFAHGFFDTAAGRAGSNNKGGLISAGEPAFEPFLNFRSPSFIQSQEIITENPFSTSKSTFIANRLLTSTLNPAGDLFFTPPTTTIRPVVTSTFVPSTTQNKNLIFLNPTVGTSVVPSRSSIFQFGNTFSSNSGKLFTPSTSAPTLSSRDSIFQFGNTFPSNAGKLFTSSTPAPTLSSRGSVFQFGNTFSSNSGKLFTPSTTVPTLSSRDSIFQFGNTFSSNSGKLFSPSTPAYQTVSTVSQASPVFIINGAKWY